jgi:hypothetical protein
MDTDTEKIRGQGSVDFINQRYDLELSALSEKASVFALRGPIPVDGTIKSPNLHPATGQIAARIGASAALGALATPFAALARERHEESSRPGSFWSLSRGPKFR